MKVRKHCDYIKLKEKEGQLINKAVAERMDALLLESYLKFDN